MIRRGTLHEVAGTAARAVVVTKDGWNARMSSVGVVPLVAGTADEGLLVRVGAEGGLAFDPTRLVSVPLDRLGPASAVLRDETMRELEERIAIVLDADRLLAEPPRAARPPAGPIDYPRCGEIHYLAGRRIDGEAKRYLVVSADGWNCRRETVLVVRTTMQTKLPVDEFPLIHEGAAQAVCGELTAIPAAAVDLRQRPAGINRVGLRELAAVVAGCTHTHLLRSYLDPFEVAAASGST